MAKPISMQLLPITLVTTLILYLLIGLRFGIPNLVKQVKTPKKKRSPLPLPHVETQSESQDGMVILETTIKKDFYQYLYKVHLIDLKEMVRFHIRKAYPHQKYIWIRMDRKFSRFMDALYKDQLLENGYIKLSPNQCKSRLENILQIELS